MSRAGIVNRKEDGSTPQRGKQLELLDERGLTGLATLGRLLSSKYSQRSLPLAFSVFHRSAINKTEWWKDARMENVLCFLE